MSKHIHIHLAPRQITKTKDASEAISLSKVLAKYPTLRAYSLSEVTYRNGEVYTVSAYDIPREEMRALEAFVKSIKTVKDAGNKFVTKADIKMPVAPELGNQSGKILPSGSVVYKEGSGYRPWFHNGNFRLNISANNVVPE